MHAALLHQICDVEPRVGLKSAHQERPEELCAMFVPNEHTGVDYIHLAEAFVSQAKALGGDKVSFRACILGYAGGEEQHGRHEDAERIDYSRHIANIFAFKVCM